MKRLYRKEQEGRSNINFMKNVQKEVKKGGGHVPTRWKEIDV